MREDDGIQLEGTDAQRPGHRQGSAHEPRSEQAHLVVHPSGEIHVKSSKTRRRFRRHLVRHLRAALQRRAPGAELLNRHGWLHVFGDGLEQAAEAAASVMGVHRVTRVEPLSYRTLDELADAVAERTRERVRDRWFAVRVRRRGNQAWSSNDAARAIGGRLKPRTRGVDLDRPDVEVRVEVHPHMAQLVTATWPGPDGLPLGTQAPSLALISGGFDSPVAAWMMMRRGSPVDYLHFTLECSQSEQAMGVTHALHERWGGGTDPLFWSIDFQLVREALLEHVESRLRQVVLKQLMIAAADVLGRAVGRDALITGESVGQVSSQTLVHLRAIDANATLPVMRPLAGMLKQEIIAWSRRIGAEAISARAREVCDLSQGPVAVAAPDAQLAEARAALPRDLLRRALSAVSVIRLDDWLPGMEWVPVSAEAPEGWPLLEARDELPDEGPVAFHGARAARRASGLIAQGRPVRLVLPELDALAEEARSAVDVGVSEA